MDRLGRTGLLVLWAMASCGEPPPAGPAGLAGPTVRRTNSAPHDWPQWRGEDRTATLPAAAGRISWPKRLVKLWEREVGAGYSGPVVVGDRIFIHARRDGRETVSSRELDDGAEVWSEGYAADFEQDPSARAHGKGPYSTPCVASGRLFTFGVRAVLSVWDPDSGTLLWRKDYTAEFDPSYPVFGAAASPLVWNDLCFVHFGTVDEQKVKRGRAGGGAMVALRIRDGEEVWRWDGDGPALAASPVVRTIEGQEQLVFKSKENIVGVVPRTGRELWRIPFAVEMDNTIVTPVLVGSCLLTADYRKGFRAWQIEAEGESFRARFLWRNGESVFMTTPVVVAGQVVSFSDRRGGQLVGIDPRDGTVQWRGPRRWGEYASLITRGNQVLVFRDNGWLMVGEVEASGFRLVREYRLGRTSMWGHPAIARRRIIIRDGKRLVCIQLPEE